MSLRSLTPAARRAVPLTAAAAALAAGLVLAPAAFAHNTLIDSSPADKATVDEPLDEVVLTFNAEVKDGGNGIVVTGPDDARVQDGEVELDGAKASIGLKPLTEPGDYTVDYRIVSADGHPMEDTIAFTLSEEAVPEPSPSSDAPAPTEDAKSDDAPAAPGTDGTPTDPMRAFGPVGGVVVAIAAIAIVAILLLRLRGRRGGGPGGIGGRADSGGGGAV